MGNTTPTAFASAMSFAMVHVEDKPHAHECKKIAEEAYDLPVEPIHELI